jgi:hypothetical protein
VDNFVEKPYRNCNKTLWEAGLGGAAQKLVRLKDHIFQADTRHFRG